MKEVLLISHAFHTRETIGAVRARAIAKHLPKSEWKPIVLTVRSENDSDDFSYAKVISTDFEDAYLSLKRRFGFDVDSTVRKQMGVKTPARNSRRDLLDLAMAGIAEFSFLPDIAKTWKECALEAGSKIVHEEHIDAILSTSPPATSHLIACELKRRFNLPWVADFRDLWSQNPYYSFSPVRKLVDQNMERRVISNADAITTVSEPMAELLRTLHPRKMVHTVLNGYDTEEYSSPVTLDRDKLTIAYTGVLYDGRRDPEILFRALQELADSREVDLGDLRVDFYGKREEWLSDEVKKHSLQEVVKIHGQVPRDDALRVQRQSQILLLLTWNDPREKGVYTGKLFDYLAARRPILALGMHGTVIDDLLDSTGAGVMCSNVLEVKKALFEAYREYVSRREVEYKGKEAEVRRFDIRGNIAKLAKVLDSVVNST